MFRLIANRRTAEEKSRIRAYIRQIGFDEANVDGLIAAADEFYQGVSPLDAEARQIKTNNRGNASPEVKAHLRELQSRKEAIADYVVARMGHRIGRDAISKLQSYIAEHVKRRVKIRSS